MLKKLTKNNLIKFCIIYVFFSNNPAYAQNASISLNTIENSKNNLFWFQENNNQGIKQDNWNFYGKYQFSKKNTDYKINVISTFGIDKKFFLGESYIKHRFNNDAYLKIGRFYRDHSTYLNDELSSGHMQISHNAQPLPKISFVKSLPFYKIDLRLGISHGQFSKDSYYRKAPLFHGKFLYINIPQSKNSKFTLGIAHNAMWGGATPSREYPVNLKNFLKVFVAADGFDPGLEPTGEPLHQNALGNHVGIWDFAYEKKENEKNLTLYYQHIFESDTGIRFSNKLDGLWGVELVNYVPKTTILLEYLSTENVNKQDNEQRERYYYNYQYVLGWSYKGYNLGNPYIPIFKDLEDIKIINAMHFAIKGDIFDNHYKIQLGRKINISEKMNYKISIERKIKNKFNIGCFVLGNNQNNIYGIILSKDLEFRK
ncbi:MAG: capsule assembly Wzi family protein [Candidatus Neomarinimicrobiota bacterium]